MKIYVASSWRNTQQPHVVEILRAVGYDVYDFRHPAPGAAGFHWSEIDERWEKWSPAEFAKALDHPIAVAGFAKDKAALDAADAVVVVLPCGKSAHLEAGYAAGRGKPVFFLCPGPTEPELMYKLGSGVMVSGRELLEALAREAA